MMPGGHWLQLEHPATFNYFVKKWLHKLPEKPAYTASVIGATKVEESEVHVRPSDEL